MCPAYSSYFGNLYFLTMLSVIFMLRLINFKFPSLIVSVFFIIEFGQTIGERRLRIVTNH